MKDLAHKCTIYDEAKVYHEGKTEYKVVYRIRINSAVSTPDTFKKTDEYQGISFIPPIF